MLGVCGEEMADPLLVVSHIRIENLAGRAVVEQLHRFPVTATLDAAGNSVLCLDMV